MAKTIFRYYYTFLGQWSGVCKKLKDSSVGGPLPLVGQWWATGLLPRSYFVQDSLQVLVYSRSQPVVFRRISDGIFMLPTPACAVHPEIAISFKLQEVAFQGRRGYTQLPADIPAVEAGPALRIQEHLE